MSVPQRPESLSFATGESGGESKVALRHAVNEWSGVERSVRRQ